MTTTNPITNPIDGLNLARQVTLDHLSGIMGHGDLSLEQKLRRAIRAAKCGDTPESVWRKVLLTIPEGVSTTRANEMFCWARSLILDQERSKCTSEAEALQNTVRRLLTSNVY
jgi:hypothetical protein